MATNTLKVLTAVSKEFSYRFDVKADLINSFNRQYDKPHAAFGSNSGSSIEVKLPQRLEAVESATLDIKDTEERTGTLDIIHDIHVPLAFTAAELTQDLLNVNNMKLFGDDYLDAAVDTIIAKMSANFYTYLKNNCYQSVGTPGTGPNSLSVVTDARAKLNNQRAGRTPRNFILDPDNASILNAAQTGLYHPGEAIAANYRDGSLSPSNGFAFIETPDMGQHTNGSGASYAVNGAGQTGSSLAVKTGTGPLTAGTILTMPGCYDLDPVSRVAKRNLKQFVVSTNYAGGAGNVSILPAIETSGPYANCSASPTDSGALTIVGSASTSYSRGFAAHENAAIFGMAELKDIGVEYEVPVITGGDGEGYSRGGKGAKKGCCFKIYMDGDITNRRAVARLDGRYGYLMFMPEWITAVQGL